MRLVDMEARTTGIYQVLWRGPTLKRYRDPQPVMVRGRVATDRQKLTVVLGWEIEVIA